jgi:hypothetical protein
MMLMYALERRHRHFTLAFAAGCFLSSAYGFAAGAWPFGGPELGPEVSISGRNSGQLSEENVPEQPQSNGCARR